MTASGVAGREVGQAVGATHGLNVVHVTLAPEVARRCQVDLERVVALVAKLNAEKNSNYNSNLHLNFYWVMVYT